MAESKSCDLKRVHWFDHSYNFNCKTRIILFQSASRGGFYSQPNFILIFLTVQEEKKVFVSVMRN